MARLLFLFQLLFQFCFTITSAHAAESTVFLDTHYHFHLSYPEHPAQFLEKHSIQKALIISDSFNQWKQRSQLDLATSQEVQVDSQKLRGLCGADLQQDNVIEHVQWCLSLPGMIGVKIHMSNLQESVNSAGTHDHSGVCFSEDSLYLQKMQQLLSALPNGPKIILIHMVPSCSSTEREVDIISQLAYQYTKVDFILAHSFSLEATEYLAKSASHQPENLFLEISTLEAIPQLLGPDAHERFLKAWQIYGLHKILFGTDNFNPHQACPEGIDPMACDPKTAKSTLSIIQDNFILSPIEKKQILWDNGVVLWKKYYSEF